MKDPKPVKLKCTLPCCQIEGRNTADAANTAALANPTKADLQAAATIANAQLVICDGYDRSATSGIWVSLTSPSYNPKADWIKS